MAISSEERKKEKEIEKEAVRKKKQKIIDFLKANGENTLEEIFNYTVRNTVPHAKNPKKEEESFEKAIKELLKENLKSKPNKEKHKDDVFYLNN